MFINENVILALIFTLDKRGENFLLKNKEHFKSFELKNNNSTSANHNIQQNPDPDIIKTSQQLINLPVDFAYIDIKYYLKKTNSAVFKFTLLPLNYHTTFNMPTNILPSHYDLYV